MPAVSSVLVPPVLGARAVRAARCPPRPRRPRRRGAAGARRAGCRSRSPVRGRVRAVGAGRARRGARAGRAAAGPHDGGRPGCASALRPLFDCPDGGVPSVDGGPCAYRGTRVLQGSGLRLTVSRRAGRGDAVWVADRRTPATPSAVTSVRRSAASGSRCASRRPGGRRSRSGRALTTRGCAAVRPAARRPSALPAGCSPASRLTGGSLSSERRVGG